MERDRGHQTATGTQILVDAHHIAATEVRAPLTQIEKWKSVVRSAGGRRHLCQRCRHAFGLDDRQARQMNLLGRLHPSS